MNPCPQPTHHLLLIEDSPGDERLLREVLKEISPEIQVTTATNGAEALALLRRVRPNLIILDLNLPMVDGRVVLDELKSDKRFKDIPICVLTSSTNPADVRSAYHRGANCYLAKPTDLNELFDRVQNLVQFWTRTAILPPD